mgnify:CR=1 FL=1
MLADEINWANTGAFLILKSSISNEPDNKPSDADKETNKNEVKGWSKKLKV